MTDKTLKIFDSYVKQCRPVWTITWRDSVAPSVRSGVPPVREEDTYFNHDLAMKCIHKLGRINMSQHLLIVNKYISSDTCKFGQVIYRVPGFFNCVHKVYSSERDAWNYFLCCIMHVYRHYLKNTTLKKN